MSVDSLRNLARNVIRKPYVDTCVEVLWHSGEPLVLPIAFYARAFDILESEKYAPVRLDHGIQTNGTLLNEKWCAFIKERGVSVSVSIDGPSVFHDVNRRDRVGNGTHDRAMRGVRLLREHGLDFNVICVLTANNLRHPKELFDFFEDIGARRIGFNCEEIVGSNVTSSLNSNAAVERFAIFLGTYADLCIQRRSRQEVREIASMTQFIFGTTGCVVSGTATPYHYISVDYAGNISTFSPELITSSHARFQEFSFGNVSDPGCMQFEGNRRFDRIRSEIEAGVKLCQQNCGYFQVCGGGDPAKKLFERNSFATAETFACKLGVKSVFEVVMRRVASQLADGDQGLPRANHVPRAN
jgi:uncharacterized protein